MPYMYDSVNTA